MAVRRVTEHPGVAESGAPARAVPQPVSPASVLLGLQRTAGNAAVTRLVAARGRVVAREWGPTGTAPGPQHGGARAGGWNAQDASVAGTLRIPIDDLATGFRGDDDQRPTTPESADRRAIVIVPGAADLSAGRIEVLLHFHGLNIGYRERDDGTVRDVERDKAEQQVAASGRNMIAVLAQGEKAYGQGRFRIGSPQAYVDDCLAKALPHVPAPQQPPGGALTASRLIMSGHSGGGPNAVDYANRMQNFGDYEAWTNSPPLLLFDAINGPGELATLQSSLTRWLDADRVWLEHWPDPPTLLRRRGLKLRSTYSTSDIYIRMNQELDRWLDRWFARSVPASLSGIAAEWRAQYVVAGVGGSHDDTMATGSEARRPTSRDPTAGGEREATPEGVDGRSGRAGVPTYAGGGNLESALRALPAPAPPPVPAAAAR